jgi:outer membrane protein
MNFVSKIQNARRIGASLFVVIFAVIGSASPASAAEKVTIPIGSAARKSESLPPGDKIELSLDRAIVLSLENTLDLDVASLGYERAGFGIGSASGAFDPYVELDVNAARSQSPKISSIQSSDSKQQRLNGFLGGLLATGATYQLGWTNSRNDSEIPGITLINPTYSSSLAASATQPLLRNFGRGVNTRLIVQARISRDISAWDFVRSVQATIQNVENAYWDLVYAQENLLSKQESLARASDLNRITKIKIDVGALAPIDIVQTEVTIAQREQDIILAEGLIGDAQDRLKRLLNVGSAADWNRPIVPTDRPTDEAMTIDLDAGLRTALETRPEVKQAVSDIESKKISLAYSHNQLLPKLDLSGSYGYGGLGAQKAQLESCSINNVSVDQCVANGGVVVTTPFNANYVDALYQVRGRDFPSWSVGLSLNIPIGNRTARANKAAALTDVELSRTNLALLKQNLQVEVRAAARAIDTAFRSVAAAHKARELADRNVDAEQKKYQNGMTTSFQVAQIQNDLTSARSFELLAIAAYRKAIAAWHKAIGDILPQHQVIISGLPVTLDPTPAEEGVLR